MIFRRVSCPVASLALTLVLALAGCSRDPDLVAAVPAAGTVTYKGKPLESGNLQLIPEKGRSASGAIKDGKFVLTTYTDNDGAIPGKHTATVTAYKEVKVKGENELQQVLIIDEKYAHPTSSGLVVEIPASGKQDIEIKLD